MTHHRRVPGVLAVLALVAAAAAARADEVTLKNGRTLVGTLSEETTQSVRLTMATGSMTIARDDIRDIVRKPVPERPKGEPLQPKPVGPRIKAGPGGREPPPTKAAVPPQPGRGMAGPDVPKLLEEMEKITLATWPESADEAVRAGEHQKAWKFAKADGTLEYSDAAPPDAATRVWKLVRNGEGEKSFLLNGIVQMAWRPVYRDVVRRDWTETHPALKDFERDTELAKRAAAALASKDPNAWVECHVQKEAIARRQAGKVRNTAVNVVPERERMASAAVRCMGTEPGGKDLVRYLEIEIEMQWAGPADKIRLAVERREVLKRMATPQR